MPSINLSNSKGRDAIVGSQSVQKPQKVRYVDKDGRQAQSARLIKADLGHDLAALEAQAGGREKIAQMLIDSDPEIDVELYGTAMKDTSRVYIDPTGRIVHRVRQFDVLRNPDGSERERRPRKVAQPNTSDELPLKWTGKLIKKSEVCRRFVLSSKRQIVHINGLTFDFLFAMAKELHDAQSLMLLGAGPKGTLPLVFTKGGQQYRGFLEGRVEGEKYCLILHLSNMELKAPTASKESDNAPSA